MRPVLSGLRRAFLESSMTVLEDCPLLSGQGREGHQLSAMEGQPGELTGSSA